jgi:hypothetical protein
MALGLADNENSLLNEGENDILNYLNGQDIFLKDKNNLS